MDKLELKLRQNVEFTAIPNGSDRFDCMVSDDTDVFTFALDKNHILELARFVQLDEPTIILGSDDARRILKQIMNDYPSIVKEELHEEFKGNL